MLQIIFVESSFQGFLNSCAFLADFAPFLTPYMCCRNLCAEVNISMWLNSNFWNSIENSLEVARSENDAI